MNKLWRLIARNLVAILIAVSGAYLLSKYILNILFDLFGKMFGKCSTYLELDILSPEEANNYLRTHPNPFYCSNFYFTISAEVIINLFLFTSFYLVVRKILIKAKI